MRTYSIAQLCGNQNGKQMPKKRGDICICMTDSLRGTAETDTIV